MYKKLIYSLTFVVVLSLFLTSTASAVLVGWWKLDEGSGTVAADSSGLGLDGTITNATWEAGRHGAALKFDGTAYVDLPPEAWSTIETQATLAFWAYGDPDAQPQDNFIFGAIQENNIEARVFMSHLPWSNGNVYFDTGGTQYDRISKVATPEEYKGSWQHWAFVKNADTGDQMIYLNGVLWHSGTGMTKPMTGVTTFTIGCGAPGISGNAFYVGMMDDVRLYDHLLTEAELLAVMEGAGLNYPYALTPYPKDGAMLEAKWAKLSWRPGTFAVSHDVYIGESFDDVNDGAESAFMGNQAETNLIIGFGLSPADPCPTGLVPGKTYYWRIDEVNDADPNSPWKGDVWSFWLPPQKAYEPSPADGAKYVFPDVTLSWAPGFRAEFRHVYFGDNPDDVNNASFSLPQQDTTYTPDTLEVEKTYYWRVDESDGLTTYKGDVWSFTTVPDVEVTNPNLTLWWTLDEDQGLNAVDWSGHGNHGAINGQAQWVDGYQGTALTFTQDVYVETTAYQGVTGTAPRTCCAWIKTTQAGRTVMSWGQNVAGQKWRMYPYATGGLRIEVNGGYNYGVTNVADGRWHHVAVTFEDDGSPDVLDTLLYVDGQPDATAVSLDEPIDTAATGVVRIGESPWHNQPFIGVIDDARVYDKVLTAEEIRLAMRGDLLVAWGPKPGNGSTPYIRDAMPLSWSPGDNASGHYVYLGIDRDAVADANASDTTGVYRGRQGATIYTPTDVEWGGGPYYWRIDESNTDGTISKGSLWTFTVADSIEIEGFEDYNDYSPDIIYETWLDGYDIPTNGAEVAYPLPDFDAGEHYVETTIVHGGDQSMPYFYDTDFKYAEATMTLTAPRDWTEEGVGVLSLWFQGRPASEGSFVEAPAGTYTMTASGSDIWGTADEFHYAFKTLSGPGSITAKVESVENTHIWAKAGVMIRETLDADSTHAMMVVTPTQGVAFMRRTITGESSTTTTIAGITAPQWVKIERDAAGYFTASYSADGFTWTMVGIPMNIPMGANVYIGLALTSTNASATCEAKFSNVSTTGTVGGQWTNQDVGIANNAAAPMYVALNGSATVYHDDPAATQIEEWTQWLIDLQKFAAQGVVLTNVNTISIGFGDKSAPQAGGSGLVFFDDIRLYRPAPPELEPQ